MEFTAEREVEMARAGRSASISLFTATLILMALGSVPARAATVVYVSAATDKQIVVLEMDETSGALRERQRVALDGEPAALIASPDRRFLFASHRSTGKLQSFRVDGDTGRLTP